MLALLVFVGAKLGWPDENWAAVLVGVAVVWVVAALAWPIIRRRSRGAALAPAASGGAAVGAVSGGVGVNYGGTVNIHNSPAPETVHTIRDVRLDDTIVRPPDTKLDIVFEPHHGEPFSTHVRHDGGLWHLYRFGVTANASTTLTARMLQIQGVSAQNGHEPIRFLASLFGPIPCDIRPTTDRTVSAGAAPTMFDLVEKRLDEDQKLHVCRSDRGEGDFGLGRTYCLRVEASGAAAVEQAYFHVWAEGRQLWCERVAVDHLHDPYQIGVADFSHAPILRWQEPVARVEKVPRGDYRLAIDVLCSNEGPSEAVARVQYREATLRGWGNLDFEQFDPNSSIYPVLGDPARRFTMKIRQPSTGAFSHGLCQVTWSVVYTDNEMRPYLTTATLDLAIDGVGPVRVVQRALDETSAARRYQRYLDVAPVQMRGWST